MTKLGDQVLAGVSAQISELQPNAGAQVELAAFSAALQNVTTQLAGLPVDNATNQLLAKVNQQVADVLAGKADLEALGGSLVNLYLVRQNLETQMPSWIANQTATSIQT